MALLKVNHGSKRWMPLIHTMTEKRDKHWDSIAWNQVNSIAIKSGHLVINLQDNQAQKYNIADIPNPELLLEIIQTTIEN